MNVWPGFDWLPALAFRAADAIAEVPIRGPLALSFQGVLLISIGGLLAMVCLDTPKPMGWLVALGVLWLLPLVVLLRDVQWTLGDDIWWAQVGVALTWVLGSFAGVFLGGLVGKKILDIVTVLVQ
jgi:hypothetical protein